MKINFKFRDTEREYSRERSENIMEGIKKLFKLTR